MTGPILHRQEPDAVVARMAADLREKVDASPNMMQYQKVFQETASDFGAMQLPRTRSKSLAWSYYMLHKRLR